MDAREKTETMFRDMRYAGWDHAIIGTISHAVFSKLYFEPMSYEMIATEIAAITSWKIVDFHSVYLTNGDFVVTVILKGY